jgi:DNA-binding SARP family transcriptional activator
MLGRLEVTSAAGEQVRFRSRTAQNLLAYLALNRGKECSSEHLQEIFWPDSDSDKQAQNLRRAVADIRHVLEDGVELGSVVVTRRNFVSLNTAAICSDVDRFVELTTTAQDQESLAEAVALYSGPLLAPVNDSWPLVDRLEFEERFAQVVTSFCKQKTDGGAFTTAIRIARSAVAAAPLREDIHVALISAYRRAGMEPEAIRQYEELERILNDAWGERPSERARLALMDPVKEEAPAPKAWDPSGGAMALDSRFYIARQADTQLEELLRNGEGVVLLQGPRQVGKSSLLARSLAFARSENISVALTDAQSLGHAQISETEALYKTFAHGIAKQLGVEVDINAQWSNWLGPNINLDTIVGETLTKCKGRVCWAIDEADLLFDRPYTNDLFGLLRSWHNRRALDPTGPWKRLTLVLAYATEAHLFISDLNQSPFNVGTRMSLRDFSIEELKALQLRHVPLENANAWKVVHDIANGHPYLSQCAFAFLAAGGKSDALAAGASRPDGPFGSHLKRILVGVTQSPEMTNEVKRLVKGELFENPLTKVRLQAAGLLSVSASGSPVFRVPIYESFLRAELK